MDEGLDFSGLVSDAGESLYNWGGILPSTKDFVDFGANLYGAGRDFVSNIPQQVSEYYDNSGLVHPYDWGNTKTWDQIKLAARDIGSDIAGQVDWTTPSIISDAIIPFGRGEYPQHGAGVPEWNPGGVIHEGMIDTRPIVDPIGILPLPHHLFRSPKKEDNEWANPDTGEPWAGGAIMDADTIRIFDAPDLNSNMPVIDPDSFLRRDLGLP